MRSLVQLQEDHYQDNITAEETYRLSGVKTISNKWCVHDYNIQCLETSTCSPAINHRPVSNLPHF